MRARDDRTRAKALICQILHEAGGTLQNKTNLYKAFWKAHVEYSKSHLGRLTCWPIVKMPNGPGISDFDELLGELMADGFVETEQVRVGEVFGFVFHLVGSGPAQQWTPAEKEAIRAGVSFITGRSAGQVSHLSHEASRSWRESRDGEELDVFLDTLDDATIERQAPAIDAAIEAVTIALQMRSA